MVAMLVEDMLEDLGHKMVKLAARLDTALSAAREESVDVAILDLNLGGAMTYPVADVLRGRGIPIVFSTGYGQGGLKEAYSGTPTLQKPFNTEALGQAIRDAMATG